VKTGHWKSSVRGSAHAQDGEPLPWYTYPAIDFLLQRDFKDRHILEFGAGQSTYWWARRAQSVLSIEEDHNWFSALKPKVPSNVTLHYVPVDPVTRSIEPVKAVIEQSAVRTFDVIAIDGHLRRELASIALTLLKPSGAVILDNAEGYGFYDEFKYSYCRRIDFFGFAPGVSLRHCTSLLYVEDCFLLMPTVPIPSIEHKSV
jgi:hypothetical protein